MTEDKDRIVIFSLSMSLDLLEKIDSLKGDIPRSRFICRILEQYLNHKKRKYP